MGKKAGCTTNSAGCAGAAFVERHSGDGRASYAAITADGCAALQAAAPRHRQQVRRLVLDRLTPQQIDQLAEIFRMILDGLDAS